MQNRINNVSFPRSGNTLLVKMLTELIPNFKFCEFHWCCENQPCSKDENAWQKDHDFHLKRSKTKDEKYVIQYRTMIESVISHYNLRYEQQDIFRHLFQKLNLQHEFDNTVDCWKKFAESDATYWKKFMNKWVINKPDNVLLVDYSDFIEKPEQTFFNILNFAEFKYSEDKAREIVTKYNISRKSNIRSFKHFDKEIIASLEGPVISELKYLNLKVYSDERSLQNYI